MGELLFDPELMIRAMEQQQLSGEAGIPNPGHGVEIRLPEGASPGELTEEQAMEMMEAEPQMFQGMLQAIVQQHPEIAQLAQQNPQAIVTLMTRVLNQAVAANGGGMPGIPANPAGVAASGSSSRAGGDHRGGEGSYRWVEGNVPSRARDGHSADLQGLW